MSAAARLLCACALSFAAVVAYAQDKDSAAAVVGTWNLVTYEDRTERRPPKFPYGEQPRGQLVYDASGHMSIQIMKVPHPKVASGDEERITPQRRSHCSMRTSRTSARTPSIPNAAS